MTEQFDTCDENLGRLFESLGTESFGIEWLKFVTCHIRIAYCTAFYLPATGAPSVIVAESRDSRLNAARAVAYDYLRGFISRDQNLLCLKESLRSRLFAWRWVHRDSIADPNYRSRFYDDVDIHEKFSFVTRAILGTIYVNLYRSSSESPFQPAELQTLKRLSAVCIGAMRKHLALLPPETDRAHQRSERLRVIHGLLASHGKRCLSPREAEVCAHIVLGYSTIAIASILGIAESTVATIRKRAYARLGINSQNELFAICLQASDLNARAAPQRTA